MLTTKKSIIDLNRLRLRDTHFPGGSLNEQRQNRFFSSDGILTSSRIPQMCQPVPRRLQSQHLFLSRPISLDEFRSIESISTELRDAHVFTQPGRKADQSYLAPDGPRLADRTGSNVVA